MAEVIIRLESEEGMVAYAIDTDIASAKAGDGYVSIRESLPRIIRPAIDGFLFALRHGILQRLLKDAGLPGPCKDCDKDRATVESATRLFMHKFVQFGHDQEGHVVPIDLSRKDLSEAYQGFIRRAPEYDGVLAGPDTEADSTAQKYIEAAPTGS